VSFKGQFNVLFFDDFEMK